MDVWNMGEHLKRGGLNSNEPIKLGIKVDNPDPMLITHVNMSLMSYCHVGLWLSWLSWLSQNKFWDVWPMRDKKKVHLFPKHCSIWWYGILLNMGEVQLPLGWCLFNVLLIQLIYWYLSTVQMFHQNCCRNWYFRPQGIGMILLCKLMLGNLTKIIYHI